MSGYQHEFEASRQSMECAASGHPPQGTSDTPAGGCACGQYDWQAVPSAWRRPAEPCRRSFAGRAQAARAQSTAFRMRSVSWSS
jgi:hypothetical protein